MTDTFTWLPSYASRRTMKPQLNMMRFGDGYVQAAPAGINPVARNYELVFERITDTVANEIELFLAEHVGQSFYWTPPGEPEPSLWLCPSDWTREHVTFGGSRLSVSLMQQSRFKAIYPAWDYDFSSLEDWTLYDPLSRVASVDTSASGTIITWQPPGSPATNTSQWMLHRSFPAFLAAQVDLEIGASVALSGNHVDDIWLALHSQESGFPTAWTGAGIEADSGEWRTYGRFYTRFAVPSISSSTFSSAVTIQDPLWIFRLRATLNRDSRTGQVSVGNVSTTVPPGTLTTDPAIIGPKVSSVSPLPNRISILIRTGRASPSSPKATPIHLRRLTVTPL